MIMDQSLRYDELQHLAGLPDYDSDVEVEGTMVVGQPYDQSESDEEEQTHLFQQCIVPEVTILEYYYICYQNEQLWTGASLVAKKD